MSTEDKKTDNELIASFMGFEIRRPEYRLSKPEVFSNDAWREVKYDTSWDWLMPVVEKINECCKETGYPDGHDFFEMRIVPVAGNIRLVYIGCILYIEWLNRQPK
jgi:hypothetical protein